MTAPKRRPGRPAGPPRAATVALQTRVPADVALRVREAAEADGRTVASWLERLIVRALGPTAKVGAK